METSLEFIKRLRSTPSTLEVLEPLKRRFKRRTNTIKTRMIAFLEYTYHYYQLHERARDITGTCVYSATEVSPGCAIGHHLPSKISVFLDKERYGASIKTLMFDEDDLENSIFPQWMHDFDTDFLREVQKIHDCANCWENKRCTSLGLLSFQTVHNDYVI